MKPLRLTIQAFGPYAGKQVFDFRVLNGTNLFLITGDTGSGKTTMFDAMGIALFGETSGGQRTGKDMRSDYAQVDMLTYSCFEFELKGAIYRAYYQPEQERPKTRGEGTTSAATAASLHRLDTIDQSDDDAECLTEGIKKTSDAVGVLLQLDSNQFRQVIMLAQGQFRKLLEANSNDREEIFERLFGTALYSRIQESLQDQGKRIKGQVGDCQKKLDAHISALGHKSVEDVVSEQKGLNTSIPEAEGAVATATRELEQARHDAQQARRNNELLDKRDKAKKDVDAIALQQPEQDARITQLDLHSKAARIKPLYDAVQELEAKVSALTDDRVQADVNEKELVELVRRASIAVSEADEGKPEIERLRTQLHKLETMKPAIQQWSALLAQQEKQQGLLSDGKGKLARLQQQIEKAEQALQQGEGDHKRANEVASGLTFARSRLADIENNIALFNKLGKQQIDVTQKTSLVEATKLQLESAMATHQQSEAKYNQALDRFMTGQAGLLARHLIDGKACPVCGSDKHPAPQPANDDMPDEKSLELLKVAAAEDASAAEAWREQLTGEQANLVASKERHQGFRAQLGNVEQETLNIEQVEAQTAVAAGEKAEGLLSSLSDRVATLKGRIEKLGLEKRQCEKTIQQASGEVQQISGQLEQLEGQVDTAYRSEPDRLDDDILTLTGKKQVLEQVIASALKHKQDQEQLLSAAKATLAGFNAQLQQESAAQNQKSKALQKQISASSFDNEAGLVAAHLTDDKADELAVVIDNFTQQHREAEALFKVAREQANGLTRQEIQPLINAVEKLAAKLSGIQQELAGQRQRLNILTDELVEIRRIDGEIEKLKAEYGILGDLADVANGTGKNSHGVNFHKFILAHILDRVLEVASIRLQQMSNDRFSLLRATERDSKRRAFGLELNLYDQHTSTQREVRTLSGGEGFQASLALALGLSDVVQEQSGGVQLDTLLIDEGFGSLSPSALDECVKVLEGIGGSGKLVGVISHVAELKERIDAQLVVSSTPSGSTASFTV